MSLEERPPLPLPNPEPLTPPEGFAARLQAIGVSVDDRGAVVVDDKDSHGHQCQPNA